MRKPPRLKLFLVEARGCVQTFGANAEVSATLCGYRLGIALKNFAGLVVEIGILSPE